MLFRSVAVAEEVPVLTVAGGAQLDPRPGAVFALREVEVVGVEERARRVIDYGPAVSGDKARFDGLFRLIAECSIESARCALQVAGVGCAGVPGDLLTVEGEGDGEVVGGEFVCTGVGELEGAGLDLELAAFIAVCEFWNGQAAVEEDEGWMVFEFAVCDPFHTDELRREYGEARVALRDYGLRIGYGVVGGFWCCCRSGFGRFCEG